MSVKVGQRYRHYKGHEYLVIALARHSEDLSELVIYKDLNNPEKIWARPREMFEESLDVDGRVISRFELME